MVPESDFTEEVRNTLPEFNLSVEMAVATEWIVRDNDLEGHMELVFVAPTDNTDELQAACSCYFGVRNRPCADALAVFKAIRANQNIYDEIMKRRQPQRAA